MYLSLISLYTFSNINYCRPSLLLCTDFVKYMRVLGETPIDLRDLHPIFLNLIPEPRIQLMAIVFPGNILFSGKVNYSSWKQIFCLFDSDDDLIRSDEDDERYFPSDEGEDYDGHSEGSGFSFGNEETKSRFTNYSMTSSVIRRNEGTQYNYKLKLIN